MMVSVVGSPVVTTRTTINDMSCTQPQIGEIRRAVDVVGRDGRRLCGSSRYIWQPCQSCGICRWVELRKGDKIKSLKCRRCTNKERWANTEYRIRACKSIGEACSNPEHRGNLSKKAKERWADPEFKDKCRRIMGEVWSNPELLVRVSGENSHAWMGGISIEPYTAEFNNRLKRVIRKRDSYTCQVCGVNKTRRRLGLHHIDYDKKHSTHDNLISLCDSCHCKTNTNREYWSKFLQQLLTSKYGYDGGKENYVHVIYVRKRTVNSAPPVLGEIRYSLEIAGKKGYDKWIWQECPICKITKWKKLAKGKVDHLKCLRCYLDSKKKGINSNPPGIGEIRFGHEIEGMKDSHKYVWQPCLSCGNPRWVPFRKGKPVSVQCWGCVTSKRTVNRSLPYINEIRYGDEVGKRGGQESIRWVWQACLGCGKTRWVKVNERGAPYALRCPSCAMKERWGNVQQRVKLIDSNRSQ